MFPPLICAECHNTSSSVILFCLHVRDWSDKSYTRRCRKPSSCEEGSSEVQFHLPSNFTTEGRDSMRGRVPKLLASAQRQGELISSETAGAAPSPPEVPKEIRDCPCYTFPHAPNAPLISTRRRDPESVCSQARGSGVASWTAAATRSARASGSPWSKQSP